MKSACRRRSYCHSTWACSRGTPPRETPRPRLAAWPTSSRPARRAWRRSLRRGARSRESATGQKEGALNVVVLPAEDVGGGGPTRELSPRRRRGRPPGMQALNGRFPTCVGVAISCAIDQRGLAVEIRSTAICPPTANPGIGTRRAKAVRRCRRRLGEKAGLRRCTRWRWTTWTNFAAARHRGSNLYNPEPGCDGLPASIPRGSLPRLRRGPSRRADGSVSRSAQRRWTRPSPPALGLAGVPTPFNLARCSLLKRLAEKPVGSR
jgi:hypothetical protein